MPMTIYHRHPLFTMFVSPRLGQQMSCHLVVCRAHAVRCTCDISSLRLGTFSLVDLVIKGPFCIKLDVGLRSSSSSGETLKVDKAAASWSCRFPGDEGSFFFTPEGGGSSRGRSLGSSSDPTRTLVLPSVSVVVIVPI